jgi:hypothetical protein
MYPGGIDESVAGNGVAADAGAAAAGAGGAAGAEGADAAGGAAAGARLLNKSLFSSRSLLRRSWY